MSEATNQPKRRGRPPGTSKKIGQRVGSRPWQLLQIAAGDSILFAVPRGKSVVATMGQISCDAQRVGLSGLIEQQHFIAVRPSNREVIDIIRVIRKEAA